MRVLAETVTWTPVDVTRYTYLTLIFVFTAVVIWYGLKTLGHVVLNGLPSVHLGSALAVLGSDLAALCAVRHFSRHYLTHPRSWWDSPISGARNWADALATPTAGILIFATVSVAVALTIVVIVEGVARVFPETAAKVSMRLGFPFDHLADSDEEK